MGLYKGASCKLCRREGTKLFLKSEKCDTPKCPLARRSYPPGFHGPLFRGKLSEYAIRLREKQKAKRFYYINETQFENYYVKASRMHGDTGLELLQFLERRLDNFVYRAGLAKTRRQARQLVKHGHFKVNDTKVNIPSYLLKESDVVSVVDPTVEEFVSILEKAKKKIIQSWLSADSKKNKYTFLKLPLRDEIDAPVNEQFIVEYYAR